MNGLLTNFLFCIALTASSHASASTYTVTSTGSGGACTAGSTIDPNCTLDAAITAGNGGGVVHFSAAVQTQTINGPFPNIQNGVTIDASPNGVVLDGFNTYNVFYVESGQVLLSHLTLQHGLGSNSGGAINNSGGDVTVEACTIAHNVASLFGGGIYNQSTMTILNSTLTDNHGVHGGGIFSSGTLTVANSTITGNFASGVNNNGGGIAQDNVLNLRSSIVALNTSDSGPDINNFSGSAILSLGFNLIGDGGSANISPDASDQIGNVVAPLDPLFAAAGLAANGGATSTLALQSASPARAAGNCEGRPTVPIVPAEPLDERDVARSVPCTVGAFDMTSIFFGGFE